MKIKMSATLFSQLAIAISIVEKRQGNTERNRWDAFWHAVDMGRFNLADAYREGLNDKHIDTALRYIFAGAMGKED
jgi:hypothetical protein